MPVPPHHRTNLSLNFVVAAAAAMHPPYRTTKYRLVFAVRPNGVGVNALRAQVSERWEAHTHVPWAPRPLDVAVRSVAHVGRGGIERAFSAPPLLEVSPRPVLCCTASCTGSRMQDRLLAHCCLGGKTWVPSSMRRPTVHPAAFGPSSAAASVIMRQERIKQALDAMIQANSHGEAFDLCATRVPRELRQERVNLHPYVPEPNRLLQGTVGYSMSVRFHTLLCCWLTCTRGNACV